MSEPIYLLDANVFIEAAKRYYAFDIAPSYWSALIEQASKQRLLTIDRVADEIERGQDELWSWMATNFSQFISSTDDADVIVEYQKVMNWAQQQSQFTETAKEEFAKVADGWLVAYAKSKHRIVVTHERPNPNSRARILIPDVCLAFQIKWCDGFQMLRELQIKLG